jgi:hypothetical protein
MVIEEKCQVQQNATNQLNVAQNSMGALSKLGAQVQWVDSQVDNKIYCTYIPSEHLIREHAKLDWVSS